VRRRKPRRKTESGEVLAEGITRKKAGNEKVTEYDLNATRSPTSGPTR